MQAGQRDRECLPGRLAVVTFRQLAQQQQPLAHPEHVRDRQVTGGAQSRQALGFGLEEAVSSVRPRLGDRPGSVSKAHQPGTRSVSALQPSH
jgi:hypothetical protein